MFSARLQGSAGRAGFTLSSSFVLLRLRFPTVPGFSSPVNAAARPEGCIGERSRRLARALVAAPRTVERRPPVWVQMSTAHLYGDPPEVWCDEGSAFGYGLAPFPGWPSWPGGAWAARSATAARGSVGFTRRT